MSTFDAPIARCDVVREIVLTDETQAECAREHECPSGQICPLCGYFVEPETRGIQQPASPRY